MDVTNTGLSADNLRKLDNVLHHGRIGAQQPAPGAGESGSMKKSIFPAIGNKPMGNRPPSLGTRPLIGRRCGIRNTGWRLSLSPRTLSGPCACPALTPCCGTRVHARSYLDPGTGGAADEPPVYGLCNSSQLFPYAGSVWPVDPGRVAKPALAAAGTNGSRQFPQFVRLVVAFE
jgi:hypothetical protein